MTGVLVAALVLAAAALLGRRAGRGAPGGGSSTGLPAGTGSSRAAAALWWSRRRGRRTGTDLAATVSELAALVRAGLGPATAWRHVTGDLGDDPLGLRLRAAAESVRTGASPVSDLRAVAPEATWWPATSSQDDDGLAAFAASWAVHERTGAPVADLLDTLARSLRSEHDADLARRAALAAPAATAKVLVALPVLGLLLGQLVGAQPLSVLMGTTAGRVCAVVGLVCAVAGIAWTRHLLRSAGREDPPP